MEIHTNKMVDEKVLSRTSVKVLTYNIFLRPPSPPNNESDWKEERMLDFIQLFDYFDVICLQEMFGSFNSRKQTIIRMANKSGLFYYVESPSPPFFSKFIADGGLLILSRFPIMESNFRPFRYGVLSDSLANKGILYAKIKIGKSYLKVFNTHLQASYFGCSEDHWNISVQTRVDQITELCSFVNEVLHYDNKKEEDTKILVMGDFNVDAYNYEKKKMTANLTYETQDEYKIMMDKLSQLGECIDVFKTIQKSHPITYGYNGEELKHYDQVLTAKEDVGSHQTLDYIFELNLKKGSPADSVRTSSNGGILRSVQDDFYLNKLELKNFRQASYGEESKRYTISDVSEGCENIIKYPEEKKLKIDYESGQVEHFLVSDKPYQQLSDHFGLSINLVIK